MSEENQNDQYEEYEEDQTLDEELEEKYASEETDYQEYKELQLTKTRLELSKKASMKNLIEEKTNRKQIELMNQDAVGALALVFYGKNFGRFVNAQVLDDNKIEVPIAGKLKEVAYWQPPITVTMDMKKYWKGGGWWWRIKYFLVTIVLKMTGMMTLGTIKFNLFAVKSDGEYCLDITQDWTPLELARKFEEFLKLQGKMLKANLKAQLLADQRDFKQFEHIILYFLVFMGIVILAFLFVMNGGKL